MTIAQQINWDFKTNGSLQIRDTNGIIYLERHDGYWAKWEYDSEGNQIYFEDSDGKIIDRRPKPCEDDHQAKAYNENEAIEMLRDVDGETMEHILKAIGMDGQMLRQLILAAPMERLERLMEEKKLHQL